MHLSRKAAYSFRHQHINRRLYMFGHRHGKKTKLTADGEAQAVCTQLELFNASGFPKLFI